MHLELSTSPVFDEKGEVMASVHLIRDITERKQTEERLQQSYQVQTVLNKLLRLSLEAGSLEELLEQTINHLISIPWLTLGSIGAIFLVEDDPQVLVMKAQRGLTVPLLTICARIPFGRCLCGQAALSGEIEFVDCIDHRHENRYEGMPLHGHYCVPMLSAGKVLGVICMYVKEGHQRDEREEEFLRAVADVLTGIVERKRRDEELRKHREHLEEMVKERTGELEEAVQATEVASRAKSDFLASMSHELRTPLNAVIGFSQVLQEQYFGKLNEKQAEYVSDILGSGQHLLSLINDVLDLAKIEAGKMELEPSGVKIKDLLESSLVMIKEKALMHGISLDIHTAEDLEGLEIMADERGLKQVMFNLLSNAAKFTPDGGAITVESRKEGKELIISVSDTGIGIAPKEQEKVFEEFYQASDVVKGKIPGTGLGLSITRRIVEMHGGRIWVESEGPGKGSRFTFYSTYWIAG